MKDIYQSHAPEPTGQNVEQEKEPIYRFPLQEVFLSRLEELELNAHKEAYEKVLEIARAIQEAGGRALLVGGCVRDVLFGKISKDFDLEVYGLEAKRIQEIVEQHAKVSEVGAAFGVLKLSFGNGIEVDVSLPRTDSKIGPGYQGFDIKTDPNMNIKEAARRRDFTMNTLAADPFTGEIHDDFGGIKDILERRLRVTDRERFGDDPLRVLRGVQFAARFGLEVDPESMQIMQEMVPRLSEISKERFLIEWKKLMLKSEKPSIGLELAMALGALAQVHPELVKGLRRKQQTELSEESDPWMQTLTSVDEAAKIIRRESLVEAQAFVLMLSVVSSHLVRGDVTGGRETVAQERIDIKSIQAFLDSLNADNETKKLVLAMIASRRVPTDFYLRETCNGQRVTDGEIRRLAKQVHPGNLRNLVLLSEADSVGRIASGGHMEHQDLLLSRDGFPARDWLLSRARALGIESTKPTQTTEGKDWLVFGFKPGRDIGRLIALSNDLRDEKVMGRDEIFRALESVTDSSAAVERLSALLDS